MGGGLISDGLCQAGFDAAWDRRFREQNDGGEHSKEGKLKTSMKKTLASMMALGLVLSVSSARAADAEKGKEVFEQCAVCHNADSDEKKMGPGLKGLFKKEKLTNGKKVDEANVRALINEGGNGMPAYAEMLEKDEKDNLIAYLKTL